MQTLTINLTAPLQAWGNPANYDHRTTSPYPTKSAIIGLLGCALGIPRDDPHDRIAQLNDQLRVAVRVDQAGPTLTDLHNVAYGPKRNQLKQTYRDYLTDAVFVVAIAGRDQLIQDLIHALKHPHFQLNLGRRACVPMGPLVLHRYPGGNPANALMDLPWQARPWFQRQAGPDVELRIVADADCLPGQPTQLVHDQVRSLNPHHRRYDYRPVAQTTVTVTNDLASAAPEPVVSTTPDPTGLTFDLFAQL